MTGPARRGDTDVIESHLGSLPPEKQAIYRLLSDTILKKYHPSVSGKQQSDTKND